jgi:small ligand-binding sensory domain FIST
MSGAFSVGFAQDSDWSEAFAAALADAWPLPEGANLGFVFATDYFAPHFAEIVARLQAETGIAAWSGTVGLGVATPEGEIFDRPALVILAGRFPQDSFRTFGPIAAEPEAFTAENGLWLAERAGTVALLQADPRTPDLAALLADFAVAAKAFTLGGLTASRREGAAVPGDGRTAGLSGVLFGPEVPVVSGLSQGCTPLGPAQQITQANRNVIVSIDGKPALQALIDLVDRHFEGRLAEALPLIHPAFPLPGRDRDDYLVRNLVGIDGQKGLVAVSEMVEPGQPILFCRRDPVAARQDLVRMLADVARRADGKAKAGVYVSCVARGPNLFGPDGAEGKLLREALGDIPLVGFYAGGEISGERLYGYTGVLTLFC